jgi:hypothetical protein
MKRRSPDDPLRKEIEQFAKALEELKKAIRDAPLVQWIPQHYLIVQVIIVIVMLIIILSIIL